MSARRKHCPVPAPPPCVVATPTGMPATSATEERLHHGGVTLEEAVRARAYQKWERAGHPGGDGVRFWLEAEEELSAVA